LVSVTDEGEQNVLRQDSRYLELLKVKEEELRIKKERIKLKDQELALDLELAEAKRNLLQAELEASGSQGAPCKLKSLPSSSNVIDSNISVNPSPPKKLDSPCPVGALDVTHAFQTIADGLKQAPLPPRDVRKFAGDPLDFHRFMTDFE